MTTDPAPPAGDPVGGTSGDPAGERLRRHPAIEYHTVPEGEHWALKAFQASTPGLTFLTTRYQRSWLRTDMIAGLAVAAYLIPQVMAYSAIVKVPPVTGLWTALFAMVLYAIMGGSRVLSVGPESTIALLAGLAIADISQDPARVVPLAAALSLVVAGWCLLGRMLRLGVVADLLSQPLLVGYLAGAAVLMVSGQLGKLTGAAVEGEEIIAQIRSFIEVIGQTQWPTLAVGLGTFALILFIHWIRPSWPAALLGVLAAMAAYATLHLGDHGVAVVGEVPSGIPTPQLPVISGAELKALVIAGLGIAIMAYSDNMLVARGFPAEPLPDERPSDREVDPQAELVALGGVHIGVGLFGGFPVSSSGSRTALALASRAQTQVYSLVACVVVVIVILAAGPIMEWMPKAALGGVVLYAASKLVRIADFKRLLRFRRREFALALITLVGTIVFGILAGVGLAVTLSLLEMGLRLARPHDAVLGRVPGLAGMHDVADYPDAQTLPGLIVYRFEAPLFFANAGELRRRVQRVVDQEIAAFPQDPPRWLLLNVEANTEVDITAADALRQLQGDLAAQGIRLGLTRIKRDLYEPLRRAGVVDLIGEDMLFPTLPVAEEAYVEWAAAHPDLTQDTAVPQPPQDRPSAQPTVATEAEARARGTF
ncbi:MAG: STAS domain-containing protein [Tetrasphaera sp.]|nr:STAS domain-containing protein [Tetrasphaera sp.]